MKTLSGGLMAVGLAVATTGCGNDPNDGQGPKGFLDPTQTGRFDTQPLVVPILNQLDISPEDNLEEFGRAELPRQSDLAVARQDYKIGRNDLVQVSITDLVQQGVETLVVKRVSESGNISLPLVGSVRVLDITEGEAERAIADAYRNANLINNAQVSVTVAEARARTFSVLGSVGAPGQYAIVQSDFRVLDALVLARDVAAQPGIENIYIIRKTQYDNVDGMQDPAPPAPSEPGEPQSRGPAINGAVYLQAAPPAEQEGVIVIEGEERSTRGVEAEGTISAPADPVVTTSVDSVTTPAGEDSSFEGFGDLQEPTDTRVIRIPLNELRSGQLKYNVVIRPDDLILVPTPAIGEYYMGGNVSRTGVYSLTGRSITLKQAIVSAGMFNALAIPSRTEIIRRLPGDREVFARVDLDKIFAGQQSDIYLKPNDVVNVGTNAAAPFLAAIRGAFRFTYGFGFLYDRNFYDDDDDNN